MNDQAVRSLLQRAADQAGGQFREPTIEQFRTRRRNRRRRWVAAGASAGVVALVAALAVTLNAAHSAAPNTNQPADHGTPTAQGRTPAAPAGFTAGEFRMAAPVIVAVAGPGPALPRPSCTAKQITASAATRPTVGGVLGVVRLVGHVVTHRYGMALRCALPITHGPTALIAADGQVLDVHLSAGDPTTPPGNPRPDLALDNGDAIWGFAWLGSSCGARAAAIEVPLDRPASGSLRVPLRGAQPPCDPTTDASVLIDGVPGWPGEPVQPARPEYAQLRLSGQIEPGTSSAQLAPIDLTLRNSGGAPIPLDPCPGYAGQDFAHARSGGFGDPITSGYLSCTDHQLVIGPGEVLHYTVPSTSLVQTPGTGAIPGTTVQVELGIAGLPLLHLTTTAH